MPLPKARKNASKTKKRQVMGEAMTMMKQEHPEMPRNQLIAIGLKASGQGRKGRKKRA